MKLSLILLFLVLSGCSNTASVENLTPSPDNEEISDSVIENEGLGVQETELEEYLFVTFNVPELGEIRAASIDEQYDQITSLIAEITVIVETYIEVLNDPSYSQASKNDLNNELRRLNRSLSGYQAYLPVITKLYEEFQSQEELRIEMEELRTQIAEVETIRYTLNLEARVKLPDTVEITLIDGTTIMQPVTWDQVFVERSTKGAEIVIGELTNLEGIFTTATIEYITYQLTTDIRDELKYEGTLLDIYYTENDRPIINLLGEYLDGELAQIYEKYDITPNSRQTLFVFPNFESMIAFTERYFRQNAPPGSYGMGVGKGLSTLKSPLLPTSEGYGYDYESYFRVGLHEMVHGLHWDLIEVDFDESDVAIREGAATYLAANEPLFGRVVDHILANPRLTWNELNSREYQFPLPYGRTPAYSVGHILFYYIDLAYGPAAITDLLTYNDYQKTFGITKVQLLSEMYDYLEEKTQTFYDYQEVWHSKSFNVESLNWRPTK
jgi:hypothetical protein